MKKITYYVGSSIGTIYTGIERLYGGWMATLEGDPFTLEDLEGLDNVDYQAEADEEIALINSLIEENEGEELTEEDIEYINDWLETWGC